MGLPYSYRKRYDSEISYQEFVIKLQKFQNSQKIKEILINDENINFTLNTGLLGLNTNVDIFKNNVNSFYYEFGLINLIKVIIVLIIIFAFTLSGIKNLLIIPSITIFIMYSLTIYHIKSTLEDIFEEIINEPFKPETLSKEQKEWLNNPNLCPACGSNIIEYDKFCPDCGLNLSRHRKAKIDPSSRTGFSDYRITYSYYIPKNNNS